MSYISIPSGTGIHDFSDRYYYGASNTSLDSLTEGERTTIRQNLWNKFLDIFFGPDTSAGDTYYTRSDGSTISLSSLLHSSGSWPPAELVQYKDYLLVEGLFAGALKSFFYDYAPKRTDITFSGGSPTYIASFQTYLTDPNTSDVAKKQNSILLWVWEVLSEMLSSINKATPTKGSYLLTMTAAEDKAASSLGAIEYVTQQNAEDYSSQALNMNRQKQAEVLRAQRSAAGKKGQTAQSMITSLRDQGTQHQQLMTTIMQSMEAMIQSIMKK
jgi:hypothetical protein